MAWTNPRNWRLDALRQAFVEKTLMLWHLEIVSYLCILRYVRIAKTSFQKSCFTDFGSAGASHWVCLKMGYMPPMFFLNGETMTSFIGLWGKFIHPKMWKHDGFFYVFSESVLMDWWQSPNVANAEPRSLASIEGRELFPGVPRVQKGAGTATFRRKNGEDSPQKSHCTARNIRNLQQLLNNIQCICICIRSVKFYILFGAPGTQHRLRDRLGARSSWTRPVRSNGRRVMGSG